MRMACRASSKPVSPGLSGALFQGDEGDPGTHGLPEASPDVPTGFDGGGAD